MRSCASPNIALCASNSAKPERPGLANGSPWRRWWLEPSPCTRKPWSDQPRGTPPLSRTPLLPRPELALQAGPSEADAEAMAASPQPRHKDPRVLRVVTRLNVGGPARQALFLTDELRNRGFDTRLVWGAAGVDEGTLEPSDDLPATYSGYLQRRMDPADDVRAARAIDGVIRLVSS